MQEWYLDRGLENSGLPRPHYTIPEELLYRAKTGEVLVHPSHADDTHGCQPIHAEPNPCPDRHLFVFDWKNLVHQADDGSFLPCTEIPEAAILRHMRALAVCDAPVYAERLVEVMEVTRELLPKAERFPGGVQVLEALLSEISTKVALS